MPQLERVVMIDPPATNGAADPRVMSWDAFFALGDAVADKRLEERRAQLDADQIASLIYTSGTTGTPKAVMLSHANIAFASECMRYAGLNKRAIGISYLPLAHIAEQLASVHSAVNLRYQIYVCSEPLKLADYVKEVRPTYFFGVPRVWERFSSVISDRLEEATGVKGKIARWARKVGAENARLEDQGRRPRGLLRMRAGLANRLLFKKLKKAIGFDRTTLFLTGAAPTPEAVANTMASLGIRLFEVYGQTEGAAVGALATQKAFRPGTVGKIMPGSELKIAEDGEILFRGPHVFKGYLKDDAATRATMSDGWVHSGDLGRIDEDGFLSIIGRKKDILITSGGKNISPIPIEGALTALKWVSQAVCIGDGRRHLTAILTLEPSAVEAFAEKNGVPEEQVAWRPDVREAIAREIRETVNPRFARVEQVRNFTLLPRPFTPDDPELTATFKIKRAVVLDRHADAIERLYQEGEIL